MTKAIYYKRNKDNDNDHQRSYFNGKARIGYDSIVCCNEEDIKQAKKQGFVTPLREVERENNKKRNSKPSAKSSKGGDIEPTS